MSTSKQALNRMVVRAATDKNYKFQKNGIIKKRFVDGKFREIGSTRHGYNVFTYRGYKLVSARVLVAKGLLDSGFSVEGAVEFLNRKVVVRRNGETLNDSVNNIYTTRPAYVPRDKVRRLSQKQIDRMVELFFDGNSVAKIARRFRRKISRSHVSSVIKRELGLQTLEG